MKGVVDCVRSFVRSPLSSISNNYVHVLTNEGVNDTLFYIWMGSK